MANEESLVPMTDAPWQELLGDNTNFGERLDELSGALSDAESRAISCISEHADDFQQLHLLLQKCSQHIETLSLTMCEYRDSLTRHIDEIRHLQESSDLLHEKLRVHQSIRDACDNVLCKVILSPEVIDTLCPTQTPVFDAKYLDALEALTRVQQATQQLAPCPFQTELSLLYARVTERVSFFIASFFSKRIRMLRDHVTTNIHLHIHQPFLAKHIPLFHFLSQDIKDQLLQLYLACIQYYYAFQFSHFIQCHASRVNTPSSIKSFFASNHTVLLSQPKDEVLLSSIKQAPPPLPQPLHVQKETAQLSVDDEQQERMVVLQNYAAELPLATSMSLTSCWWLFSIGRRRYETMLSMLSCWLESPSTISQSSMATASSSSPPALVGIEHCYVTMLAMLTASLNAEMAFLNDFFRMKGQRASSHLQKAFDVVVFKRFLDAFRKMVDQSYDIIGLALCGVLNVVYAAHHVEQHRRPLQRPLLYDATEFIQSITSLLNARIQVVFGKLKSEAQSLLLSSANDKKLSDGRGFNDEERVKLLATVQMMEKYALLAQSIYLIEDTLELYMGVDKTHHLSVFVDAVQQLGKEVEACVVNFADGWQRRYEAKRKMADKMKGLLDEQHRASERMLLKKRRVYQACAYLASLHVFQRPVSLTMALTEKTRFQEHYDASMKEYSELLMSEHFPILYTYKLAMVSTMEASSTAWMEENDRQLIAWIRKEYKQALSDVHTDVMSLLAGQMIFAEKIVQDVFKEIILLYQRYVTHHDTVYGKNTLQSDQAPLELSHFVVEMRRYKVLFNKY